MLKNTRLSGGESCNGVRDASTLSLVLFDGYGCQERNRGEGESGPEREGQHDVAAKDKDIVDGAGQDAAGQLGHACCGVIETDGAGALVVGDNIADQSAGHAIGHGLIQAVNGEQYPGRPRGAQDGKTGVD